MHVGAAVRYQGLEANALLRDSSVTRHTNKRLCDQGATNTARSKSSPRPISSRQASQARPASTCPLATVLHGPAVARAQLLRRRPHWYL